MNSKERIKAVIKGEEPDRVPVFPLLMSFAAKHYGVSYKLYASNGHVMAESQLKIKEIFNIDAITSCSDAFRVSADLGGKIIFPEEKPPFLMQPLVKNEYDFRQLKKPDMANPKGRMADRVMGTSEMVKAIGDHFMVLGWVDMPFAEACSICGVQQFMLMLYDNPDLAHKLLNFLTDIVIEFALAQIEVGAPMIGAGDATASLISPEKYRTFVLPYEQRVCEAVHKVGGMVKLHICGNTTNILKDMMLSGADLFNVDYMVDFKLAVEICGKSNKAYKGNLNPVSDMLQSTPEECSKKAKKCIQLAKNTKYILSAGCEVPAEVTDEVFEAFCSAWLMIK